MNIITIAKVVAPLFPVISDIVKNVEAAVGSGNGVQKKELAIALIKSIYEASSPPMPFDQLLGHITEAIAAFVAFYNDIKAFVKPAQQVAA